MLPALQYLMSNRVDCGDLMTLFQILYLSFGNHLFKPRLDQQFH